VRGVQLEVEQTMEKINGLSNEEIKEVILEYVKDLGVDTTVMEIKVVDGPGVILSGKVDSAQDHGAILATIMDVVGIDDIIDEMVVIQDPVSVLSEKDLCDEKASSCDEDEEEGETEDVFQSVEDGIPYTPPTSPVYQEHSETVRWRKRKTSSLR